MCTRRPVSEAFVLTAGLFLLPPPARVDARGPAPWANTHAEAAAKQQLPPRPPSPGRRHLTLQQRQRPASEPAHAARRRAARPAPSLPRRANQSVSSDPSLGYAPRGRIGWPPSWPLLPLPPPLPVFVMVRPRAAGSACHAAVPRAALSPPPLFFVCPPLPSFLVTLRPAPWHPGL